MFFSITINKHLLQPGTRLNRNALTIECDPRFVRTESTENGFHILFGLVYGEEKSPLSVLASRLENEFLPGRYLLLEFQPEKKQLRFWLDKYRLLNPLIFIDDASINISNQFPFAPHIPQTPDTLGEQSLKELGAVIYPRTLLKNLQFITGNGSYASELQMDDHAVMWPTESLSRDAEYFVSLFKEVMSDLVSQWKPDVFRMSGGVDTRLMAMGLTSEQRKKLRHEVLCHPSLDPAEDRDVLGAVSITENFDIDVLHPEWAEYNYLGGLEGQLSMSGIYGGEFLGGLLYHFSPPLHLKTDVISPDVQKELKERRELLGERRFHTELFLSSFRSTIYNSVHNSWANPWHLNQFALSPFVEQKFLDALLAENFEQVAEYKLYAKMAQQIMGDKTQLPLSSPIVLFQKGFNAFTVGTDPKSVPSSRPAPSNVGVANLENFLTRYPSPW